jgi:hypothetical protein
MEERKSVPIPLVIIGLVVLVILSFFVASRFMPRTEPITSKPSAKTDWLLAKAKECRGDISKLSPEDQKTAAEYGGGPSYAGMSIRKYWEVAQAQGAK